MGPYTYEITFAGQAGSTLRAEFDDCEVIISSGTTTLRADVPDQGALWGIVERVIGLGLEVIDLHLVAPPRHVRQRAELPCSPSQIEMGGNHPGRGEESAARRQQD